MTAILTAPPPAAPPAVSPHAALPKVKPAMHPFTGDEYDRMVEAGILTRNDRVELIEGMVVEKMPANPPHENAVSAATELLIRAVPDGWTVRSEKSLGLSDSRPEPDVAVARGNRKTYAARRPLPAELGLVIEVSDPSLDFDQEDKARVYARDRIPVYWIVHLPDRRVEVYTDPTGPGDQPRYATTRHYGPGGAVPVELDGQAVAAIPVDELLP
jgi:Uma2 family endonuclease